MEDVVEDPGFGSTVSLACLDDDAQGEQLSVAWELELDRRIDSEEGWKDIGKKGFDPPRQFAAFLNTLRWNCVTATDPRLFQSPFRAGIRIDPYQLVPLRKALRLPRVNLFIADDVGLGKTIEAGLIASELLLRRRVRDIVVACPPSMILQWKDELESRFGLTFEIFDRAYMEKIRRERGHTVNAWDTFPRFLISHKLLIDETYVAPMRAPVVREPRWMPVVENRGEGIFLKFDSAAIEEWAASEPVVRRAADLEQSLEAWKKLHPSSQADFPGGAYIMLHSLSHMLISAISLECGYPLSSLRERIYAPDGKGAMEGRYGILLYTSSSGAEGTLGGLVQSARDIRKHLFRAMQLGTLCSNDPVCSTRGVKHGGIDRISGSACHGCLYISETSCERFNQFLDRSLVVPTIDRRGCEFLTI